MRTVLKLSLIFGAALLSTAANAQLAGRQVNGAINFGGNPLNHYDPANGNVGAGYGNTSGLPVTIGAGIEFGFVPGGVSYNSIIANFTDTQLILNDVELFATNGAWTQTFTLLGGDPFSSISLVSSDYEPGLTYSLNAGTIQIDWAGPPGGVFGGVGSGRSQAVFNIAVGSGAVPEPATWALMIGGFGLVAGAMRRRGRTASPMPGIDAAKRVVTGALRAA